MGHLSRLKILYSLPSFKDMRLNVYHLKTTDKEGKEYLSITQVVSCQKRVLESFTCISSGLYCTHIKMMESHTVLTRKVNHPEIFILRHERLGHPGAIMMHQINTSSHGHPLKDYKMLINNDYSCSACSMGKLITRPSKRKVAGESPRFLK